MGNANSLLLLFLKKLVAEPLGHPHFTFFATWSSGEQNPALRKTMV